MAPTGGTYGVGTIYKIHPDAGTWDFQVVHTFTGGADGSSGSAEECFERWAALRCSYYWRLYGSGVIFQLTPTVFGEWDFRTLYSFHGQPDGSFPYGALLRAASGRFYGTTYYGGRNGIGAVYELSPRPTGEWRERVIYSFQSANDGNSPISNLVSDAAGNLYGTTSEGGLGSGVIFKLSPTGGQWTESVVHEFRGSARWKVFLQRDGRRSIRKFLRRHCAWRRRTTTVPSTSLRLKAAQHRTQQKSNRQAPVSCLRCRDRITCSFDPKEYGFVILSKVIL